MDELPERKPPNWQLQSRGNLYQEQKKKSWNILAGKEKKKKNEAGSDAAAPTVWMEK